VSIHNNPDGSVTEGYKQEYNGTFVAHAFVATLTSAVGIGSGVAAALAKGADQAVVQAVGNPVFYRLDGTAPTASVGVEIPAGQSVAFNMQDAANALFIQSGGTASLAVTFTM
jgi:hypothetical protein